jgi:hypothetical protein
LLVQLSIISRVKGGIKFETVISDSVENIFQSISVSVAFSGRKFIVLPFFAMNTFSQSFGYTIQFRALLDAN